MAKAKTVYICQQCGAQSPKWVGKCTSCGSWNSFVEDIAVVVQSNSLSPRLSKPQNVVNPLLIGDIQTGKTERIDTHNGELNRVLGGGMVPGAVMLLAGEPGIGKSTLVLQVALNLVDKQILYVSGEESAEQIKLRAVRLSTGENHIKILSDTSLENIIFQADVHKPDVLIIDSIQTIQSERLESAPGSVGQIRECTQLLTTYVKRNNLPLILIGHITKDGTIAGPKVLEHMVDCVLQFEGDMNHVYRILRATKNRFGSTSEVGIFEMLSTGLREVANPSEILISDSEEELSGAVIAGTVEGARPLLIEVQALVSTAVYGTPQRSAIGYDLRRINMLLAVLERRVGFRLSQKDVFVNIAGGMKIIDPAVDLALIIAILSSDFDLAMKKRWCFAGEVGLTGEVRPIQRIEQRISEARKLGFERIFVPAGNLKNLPKQSNIQVIGVSRVDDVLHKVFKRSQ